MKITAVKAIAVTIPKEWTNFVFVKVETDGGVSGWGECSIGYVAVKGVAEELGKFLIGKDPSRIEEHWQALYHLEHNVRGGVYHTAAISGTSSRI